MQRLDAHLAKLLPERSDSITLGGWNAREQLLSGVIAAAKVSRVSGDHVVFASVGLLTDAEPTLLVPFPAKAPACDPPTGRNSSLLLRPPSSKTASFTTGAPQACLIWPGRRREPAMTTASECGPRQPRVASPRPGKRGTRGDCTPPARYAVRGGQPRALPPPHTSQLRAGGGLSAQLAPRSLAREPGHVPLPATGHGQHADRIKIYLYSAFTREATLRVWGSANPIPGPSPVPAKPTESPPLWRQGSAHAPNPACTPHQGRRPRQHGLEERHPHRLPAPRPNTWRPALLATWGDATTMSHGPTACA
eukprot:scaffold175_cov414-Prasinococcus_capsulatus_cf.AAC.31